MATRVRCLPLAHQVNNNSHKNQRVSVAISDGARNRAWSRHVRGAVELIVPLMPLTLCCRTEPEPGGCAELLCRTELLNQLVCVQSFSYLSDTLPISHTYTEQVKTSMLILAEWRCTA